MLLLAKEQQFQSHSIELNQNFCTIRHFLQRKMSGVVFTTKRWYVTSILAIKENTMPAYPKYEESKVSKSISLTPMAAKTLIEIADGFGVSLSECIEKFARSASLDAFAQQVKSEMFLEEDRLEDKISA